jgi:hypothetical protein
MFGLDLIPSFVKILCMISERKYADRLSHNYKFNACISCGISGHIPLHISLKLATAVRYYRGTFTQRFHASVRFLTRNRTRIGHESQMNSSTISTEEGTEI